MKVSDWAGIELVTPGSAAGLATDYPMGYGWMRNEEKILNYTLLSGGLTYLGLSINGLVTDIQVNVYIGNTLLRLSFQN